ncbi:MAG TPA: glucokinase [Myxococcales bacterium]|nr:glucokinase [Myxococcales bacterium]
MQVLAGDIGGTKTLLAICDVSPLAGRGGAPTVEVLASNRYDSHGYPGLGVICRLFASEIGRPMPRFAGFGVAGPVSNGRCHTTNLPWILDERELAPAIGVESVYLANDFQTLALGIAAVKPTHLAALNPGAADASGPWAVLGAGTGLGEAISTVGSAGQREIFASEGGHASFAPRNEFEMGILRFLLQRHDHVSWERVLCGDGLVNLVEALAHLKKEKPPAEVEEAIAHDRRNAPPLITAKAAEGDPLCRAAVQQFCELYGAEAGNLALKALATGGVYVAGGIAPRILDFMTDGRFREAFCAKGRMRPLLEKIPVRIVLDNKAGLMGAATLAARAAQLSPREKKATKANEP